MTVEQALKESRSPTFTQGRAIRAAQAMIHSGECVQAAIMCNTEVMNVGTRTYNSVQNYFDPQNKLPGIAVLTDQRIFFCNANAFGDSKLSKMFSLQDIHSVEHSATLGCATLRIQGIFETLVINTTEIRMRGLRTRLEQAVSRIQREAAEEPQPVRASQDTETLEEQIHALKRLLDGGYLTSAEYEAKKKQILGL